MYAIFNIALDCDILLPELPTIETADVVLTVREGMKKENIPEQPIWFHHWTDPDGNISISCAKQENAYLLRFPKLIDFTISKSGKVIQYYPEKNIPQETVRHLLLDQVVPRVLGHQGKLVLHASAVEVMNNVSIAFIGESGYGKSTLASSFHQSSAKLITDDCLLLEKQNGEIFGIPNYYGVRLYDDSATAILDQRQSRSPVAHYSTKSRFSLPGKRCQKRNTHYVLTTLFLITDPIGKTKSDNVEIISIKGAEELISIIKQTFVLDVTDKASIKRQFNNLSKLVSSSIEIYHLQYPREYKFLPSVRAKIKSVL